MSLQVTDEIMRASATQVDNVNHTLDGIAKALRGEVAGSQSMWEGNAHGAFTALMARYDDATSKIHEKLGIIAEQLRACDTGYKAAEEDHSQQIASVGGALDMNA
ncbi:WXG100 family type VII secretion target [Antrihabitans sp. YC2-6]|uniref:WXG100 family type VII secretion target n=1 Tax=Antrihabitans sp. YC2-6 TaxID=2799498 RepID=UPI0018F3A8EC|nr:WXG100 family type VII secretion target [Antrihabitans sp. YC2-6]MBJ8347465.1 WXG100 family type VII secretion target [Antrihabitans sp. YC2-6]